MFKVKECLDVHRWIIACEAPPMVHAGTCMKQKRCEEDWKQLWWNGMEINLDCWRAVLFIVKGQSTFEHEGKLITRTANDLARLLIIEPNFEDFGRAVQY
ncbi:hypothetical protein DFH29DRAFT_931544 [Suillus ampliporus]|nr:hypothetical protein DFH29DRAFT_931544 [Suillus ampliporus]